MEEATAPSLYERNDHVAPACFEVYPKRRRGLMVMPYRPSYQGRELTYADFLSPWQAPLRWPAEVSYRALIWDEVAPLTATGGTSDVTASA